MDHQLSQRLLATLAVTSVVVPAVMGTPVYDDHRPQQLVGYRNGLSAAAAEYDPAGDAEDKRQTVLPGLPPPSPSPLRAVLAGDPPASKSLFSCEAAQEFVLALRYVPVPLEEVHELDEGGHLAALLQDQEQWVQDEVLHREHVPGRDGWPGCWQVQQVYHNPNHIPEVAPVPYVSCTMDGRGRHLQRRLYWYQAVERSQDSPGYCTVVRVIFPYACDC